jgi:hypothetical protein
VKLAAVFTDDWFDELDEEDTKDARAEFVADVDAAADGSDCDCDEDEDEDDEEVFPAAMSMDGTCSL